MCMTRLAFFRSVSNKTVHVLRSDVRMFMPLEPTELCSQHFVTSPEIVATLVCVRRRLLFFVSFFSGPQRNMNNAYMVSHSDDS